MLPRATRHDADLCDARTFALTRGGGGREPLGLKLSRGTPVRGTACDLTRREGQMASAPWCVGALVLGSVAACGGASPQPVGPSVSASPNTTGLTAAPPSPSTSAPAAITAPPGAATAARSRTHPAGATPPLGTER